MMFCNKCGATLVENARFCNICGAPNLLYSVQQPPQTAPTPQAPVYAQTAGPAQTPAYEQPPVSRQAPVYEQAPAYEQPPVSAQASVYEQPPVSRQAPAYEQPPVSRQAPVYEQAPVYAQAPQAASAQPLFAPSTFHIVYQLVNNGEFKTGFHMGGNEDEGYLDLTPSSMKLYKKSKGVVLAFGMVGSLIEGKGKFQEEILRASIVSYTKTRNKKGKVSGYIMNLNDGRSFMALLVGRGRAEDDPDIQIFDRFLTQQIDCRVP